MIFFKHDEQKMNERDSIISKLFLKKLKVRSNQDF